MSLKNTSFAFVLILCEILSTGIFGTTVHASQTNNNGIPFNLSAIKPQNQINKSVSYIDALYKPGQREDLKVKVGNTSNQPQRLVVEANNATTSNGLAIDYTNNHQKLINNPQFANLVNFRKQNITIPAKQNKIVTLILHMPNNKFKGIIMGGISVFQNEKYIHNNQNKSGFQNRFVYTEAALLRNQKGMVKPDLQLKSVGQQASNYAPAVVSKMQNPMRNMIGGLTTKTTVRNDDGKVVARNKTNLGQVAPISQFDMIIPLKNSLPVGYYTLDGEAKSNTNQKWHWHKSFEVTSKNYNDTEKHVIKNAKPFPWVMVIIISLIIIVLILLTILILIFLKHRKDRKLNNEKR